MIKECDKNMEWYEDAGNEVGYKEYQTKAYSLSGDFSKLKIRKAEHKFRQENLEVVIENLTNMKSNMQQIHEAKEWITEEEAQTVTDKIVDLLDWI